MDVRSYGPSFHASGDVIPVLDAIVEGGNESLTWHGRKCWKNPLDLIIYQQLVFEVEPTVVIETGTNAGGSARFWRDMMMLIDRRSDGHVISIDVNPAPRQAEPADEPGSDYRIMFLLGNSTSPQIIKEVKQNIAVADRVLVNLDSDHNVSHVARELELYAPLVSVGSYLIVEDGVDDFRFSREGPYQATVEFLERHPEFEADPYPERLGLTNCPGGFLRRLA